MLMCLGLREGSGYTKADIFVYSLYMIDGLFVGLQGDDKSPGYVQTVYGEERCGGRQTSAMCEPEGAELHTTPSV
jgi:hypothetical protein